MTKQERITVALQQVTNLESLCEGLEYSDYLTSKCMKLRYELQRQLSLVKQAAEVPCDW